MSAPAVIQGSYADLRFVKGRKVCQVVVEIPIEAGDQFVSIFGAPNPAAEVPVALARMGVQPVAQQPQEPQERRRMSDLGSPQQAALCCQSQAFQRFLYESAIAPEMSEGAAADAVRKHCDVSSRAEIGKSASSFNAWRRLYDRFVAWKEAA